MTESFQPPEQRGNFERMPPRAILDLYHEALEVSAELAPVIPRGIALRDYGIVGEVKLIIAFPSGDKDLPPSEIGLVDYGEDVERHPVPFMVVDGVPQEGLGTVNKRYGLRPLNYEPQGMLVGQVPLRPDVPLVLGTADREGVSYNLGLAGDAAVNAGRVAPRHATVGLGRGMFSIVDHSQYSTQVIVAEQPPSMIFWRRQA